MCVRRLYRFIYSADLATCEPQINNMRSMDFHTKSLTMAPGVSLQHINFDISYKEWILECLFSKAKNVQDESCLTYVFRLNWNV